MRQAGDRIGPEGEAHFYRAHGLTIRSTVEIPEFSAIAPGGTPDVEILIDDRADALTREAARIEGVPRGEPFAMRPPPPADGGCFHIDDVASFWVREGREIRIAPMPGCDRQFMTLFILGSAMGLLLFQRGAFVLHGASVAHDGRATLLLGPSGAGKSTLAAQLGRAGLPILGDDTVALWPGATAGEFRVHPAGTSFKLWRDALEAAGLAGYRGESVGGRLDKFYLANPSRPEERGHDLAEVLILERGAPDVAPRILGLDRLEAVRALTENVYRPQFVDVFGGAEQHFRHAAALAGRAEVGRLVRPWDHAATGAVVGLLRERWRLRVGGA